MEREFIIMPEFDRNWVEVGLNDKDLREFQDYLCKHPDSGRVIKGTGGLRKFRWNTRSKGKRGGIRTIYIDFVGFEKIYLITAYPKNVKEDLTFSEKREMKKAIQILKNELERKYKK